jgi:carbonic anhydrase
MSMLPELLAANEKYAATFTSGDLPPLPKRKLAIITCMDCRLDVFKMMGLGEGDAHVLRNAGARVTPDVIRSLILSYQVLGTREFVVIHHTECGLKQITNEGVREELRERGGMAVEELDFLPFTDQVAALGEDVRTIRNSHFIPDDIPVAGLIYDVKTGRLEHVV